MKNLSTIILFLLISSKIFGQDYSLFKSTLNELQQISSLTDSTTRNNEIEKWWTALQQ